MWYRGWDWLQRLMMVFLICCIKARTSKLIYQEWGAEYWEFCAKHYILGIRCILLTDTILTIPQSIKHCTYQVLASIATQGLASPLPWFTKATLVEPESRMFIPLAMVSYLDISLAFLVPHQLHCTHYGVACIKLPLLQCEQARVLKAGWKRRQLRKISHSTCER